MKKEEILEKSRREKRDEGKEFVLDRGRKSGALGMVIIFSILAIFNLYNKRQVTNFALLSMFFGYLGCESFGIYYITKKRMDLLKIIIGSVLSVYFFVMYIILQDGSQDERTIGFEKQAAGGTN